MMYFFTLLSGTAIADHQKSFFKIFCPRISANWREYFSFLKVVVGKSAKLVFNWRLFAFIRGQNFLLLGYANLIPLSNEVKFNKGEKFNADWEKCFIKMLSLAFKWLNLCASLTGTWLLQKLKLMLINFACSSIELKVS